MRTPTEHIKTLQRRIDFLKSREHINSFDKAEVGSLEWALVNLQPQRTWVGLTDEEIQYCVELKNPEAIAEEVEAKLKEKNT